MEIKIDQSLSAVTVVFQDKRYEIRKPKIKEARKLNLDLQNKELSTYDVMGSFLGQLGLPQDVFEEMSVSDCEATIRALTEATSKKN
jgi:hypothetical protein